MQEYGKYGNGKSHAKTYFPYALATQTASDFQNSKRIETCIPGISASRPDVVSVLESCQHYAGPEWKWLPVSFHFSTGDVPVLSVLEQAVHGVKKIVPALAAL